MNKSLFPDIVMDEICTDDHSHSEERSLFQVMLGNSDFGWVGDYMALLDEGWYWRDACYIAWKGSPRPQRRPETMEMLANLMGFSVRTLKGRLTKNPAIRLRAARTVAARAFDAVDDVWDALIASASDPNYKNHPDRKLYMEMTGQYTPKQAIDLGVGEDDDDLSRLGRTELARLAALGSDNE